MTRFIKLLSSDTNMWPKSYNLVNYAAHTSIYTHTDYDWSKIPLLV